MFLVTCSLYLQYKHQHRQMRNEMNTSTYLLQRIVLCSLKRNVHSTPVFEKRIDTDLRHQRDVLFNALVTVQKLLRDVTEEQRRIHRK